MVKTLVILAAGLGSRFGNGIKQLEQIDSHGHIIIDYSVHDAIQAGFNKIVFVIRHGIEKDFMDTIGKRIEEVCHKVGVEVCYAYQEIDNIPYKVPEGRVKPWGTGHAVLASKDYIEDAFSVINADDYYGKQAFLMASEFLEKRNYGLIAYILKNTLSENGGVTRGICSTVDGMLSEIEEVSDIKEDGNMIKAKDRILEGNTMASMNFWCYPGSFIDELASRFDGFYKGMKNELKDEYLLPCIAGDMVKEGYKFKPLLSCDKWFGVTYKEDRNYVCKCFDELIKKRIYKEELFSDLKK